MSRAITQFTTERPSMAALTESERCAILASERRRVALDVLEERSEPIDRTDLAAEIAARERGSGATDEQADATDEQADEAIDREVIDRIEVALHHAHLPKLAAAGVVDYDAESERISI